MPYLQHSFWFMPNVAACHSIANLLAQKQNTFWHDYKVVVAASLRYTGIDSHPGLTHYGLYDTVVAREDEAAAAYGSSSR